ncbi:MAG: hypothetical protein IJX77_01755 [Ruminococcus sp.]|nr:hypothetical protein [Ruminococcus sp.]
MNTQIDKQKIVSEIKKAADAYKKNLVGKTFLYVFEGQYIEVMFKTKDFKHLTGVDSKLSAQEFYKKAVKKELQSSQVFFSARHPYKLAQKKLKHLHAISSLVMGESFMLKDIKTQTETYKFGTTDLKFSLCFNKEYDNNGTEQGTCFIAKSLRDEDCFSKSSDAFTITHIFSKKNDEKKYNQEVYCEKGYTITELSPEIKSMLSADILGVLRQCAAVPNQSQQSTVKRMTGYISRETLKKSSKELAEKRSKSPEHSAPKKKRDTSLE